jgi:hypothetical protein
MVSSPSSAELPEWPETVMGGKYVRLLEQELGRLRDQTGHGNQRLFLDDVFIVYLLAFFNPSIRSLRTIEDFSQTRQAQKRLSVRKICKSTLSDFNRLADPARLAPIVERLRAQLDDRQGPGGEAGQLAQLLRRTVAVDGTFLPAMADVAWAVVNRNNHGATRRRARVDARVSVVSWLPEALTVPEPGQSEAEAAAEHVRPGCISLYDRGFMSFALVKAHSVCDDSHFVARYKPEGNNSPPLIAAAARPLAPEDRAAGVTSDRTGRFAGVAARRAGIDEVELREVVVRCQERGEPSELRLITNLLTVPAATIAVLYRQRWQVELFFRWLKTLANFNHLISHCREGLLAHLYVTIIAALLMYLHTGFRPSKYLIVLLGQVAAGGATLEDVLPILRERERRCELDRQSRARRAAHKQADAK